MSEIKQSKTIQIKRSQINMANYNPRQITAEARKKLEKNLETMGLMGGIVWNKTTGNLVSGHQRLTILDKKQKYNKDTKENDYSVYVVEVELTEKQEKEQNIFFNNQSAMGFFDEIKLKDVMKSIDFSEMTGFSKKNQVALFAETELTDEEYTELVEETLKYTDSYKDVEKDARKEFNGNYVVLVFKNNKDCETLLSDVYENIQFTDGRFCNGEEFLEYIYNNRDDND